MRLRGARAPAGARRPRGAVAAQAPNYLLDSVCRETVLHRDDQSPIAASELAAARIIVGERARHVAHLRWNPLFRGGYGR
jgi:hypothetical protein